MQPQDVTLLSRDEANAILDAWRAEQQAKTFTPDELDAEREWLLAQEPSEENDRRRNPDIARKIRLFNKGLLRALPIAPPSSTNGGGSNGAMPPRAVQRPREHRRTTRARARAPSSDDGPEPPRPLTGRERSYLKQLVSDIVRERLASRKVCQSCYLELPREAFRPARRTCTDCEISARIERRQAVMA